MEHRQLPSDFTRKRDLPFNKLVTLILSLSGSGTNQGVDTKAGLLFKNARRCGLWPDTTTVHRSTITKARAKIPWNVFQTILSNAVKAAYDLWPQDEQRYQWKGFFLFRAPATQTFNVVHNFIKNGKKEDIIWITPSHDFKRKVSLTERKKLKPVKLRVIRLQSADGTLSVLLTNLFGKNKYLRDEIIQLYFRRWEIENYYRDEKTTLQLEKFHSKTTNGILQEFYAAMIMSVITRTLMALSSQWYFSGQRELQFKNAILTLSSDAALLAADDLQKALIILKEIVREMARVKYYRPKIPRPVQPRVNKGPINRWNRSKIKKMSAFA